MKKTLSQTPFQTPFQEMLYLQEGLSICSGVKEVHCIVYRKEGTRIPSLNTRANVTSWFNSYSARSQPPLNPFFGMKFLDDYGFWLTEQ